MSADRPDPTRPRSSPPHGQRGMVLLLALAALAMLVPLVYSGMESQRFHLRRIQREVDLEIARRQADSLRHLVAGVLALDGQRNNVTDHLAEPWAFPLPLPGEDGASAEAVVEDSARRWNLNALRKPDGQIDPGMRALLQRLLGRAELPGQLLVALEERIAPGGIPPERMVEPLHALEELLALPGWNGEALEKIRPFVTVFEGCPTTRLNLNTAAVETLELLDPTQAWEKVARHREESPFNQPGELVTAGVTLAPPLLEMVGVNSACYVATIRSRVNGTTGTLTVWMSRTGSRVTVAQTRWNG